METVSKHLFIRGRVQGVGFRHFTKTRASQAGLVGWVRNMKDGRVEAILVGPEDEVNQVIEQLKTGPPAGRVDEIEIRDAKNEAAHKTFVVKR